MGAASCGATAAVAADAAAEVAEGDAGKGIAEKVAPPAAANGADGPLDLRHGLFKRRPDADGQVVFELLPLLLILLLMLLLMAVRVLVYPIASK